MNHELDSMKIITETLAKTCVQLRDERDALKAELDQANERWHHLAVQQPDVDRLQEELAKARKETCKLYDCCQLRRIEEVKP